MILLPIEMIIYILDYIDPKSALSLLKTCKLFYEYCDLNYFNKLTQTNNKDWNEFFLENKLLFCKTFWQIFSLKENRLIPFYGIVNKKNLYYSHKLCANASTLRFVVTNIFLYFPIKFGLCENTDLGFNEHTINFWLDSSKENDFSPIYLHYQFATKPITKYKTKYSFSGCNGLISEKDKLTNFNSLHIKIFANYESEKIEINIGDQVFYTDYINFDYRKYYFFVLNNTEVVINEY